MKSAKSYISIIITSLILIIVFSNYSYSSNTKDQAQSGVPSVKIKDIKGENIDTKNFNNNGKPFVINFWATWCKPCVMELNTIAELYPEWQKATGVKIYAISVDDTRGSKRVAPYVTSHKWAFEVLLDENSDFKRAMNVNNPPHTFLYNGKGELVWQHNGFAAGDEDELFKQIKKVLEDDSKK